MAKDVVKETDYWDEKVKLKLFKDADRYSEDVTVGINGVQYQIQRGVEVEVPRCVAEAIRVKEERDFEIYSELDQMSNSFTAKSKNL